VKRIFISFVWPILGQGLDQLHKEGKEVIITPNAYGIVFDIGAGYGHTVNYLDPQKVKKYIALEPNHHFHSEIRTMDGCKMNRPSDKLVAKMGCWETEEVWDIPGEVDHFFPHKSGRYIKKNMIAY